MAQEQESNVPQNIVTVEEVGPCKKKVSIEIPAEAIQKVMDDQYNDLRKEIVLPGFRKGRAPRRLLEKRFGKETSEQVKLTLLADSSDAAMKDNDIAVLGEPDIKVEEIELPAEGPLKYDFEVEVWPEFELPELEGIAVTKTAVEVADDQVDAELDQLRRYSGVWEPRGEGDAIELDDQVMVDALVKVEDVEEAEKHDNTQIMVRENGFVAGIPVEKLGELLVGAKVGDTRETSVEVAKTFFKEEYRGKKVDITIEIKDIKAMKPAEIDKGFLDRYGVEDEDELKTRIREMLEGRQEQQAQGEMSEQIYKYLLDSTSFELPLDVVAQQAGSLLQRQYVRLLSQGLEREKLEEQMEALRASSEEQAQDQLKTFFIMDKVSDKLDIQVTEEEVNGQIAYLAMQRGQRPERMKEQMERDGSLSQFRLEIRQNKCIEKLLETAQIAEVAPSEKKTTKSAPKKKATKKKATKKAAQKSDDKED